MRKPLPARALCRLLFLVAAGAASRPALAQTISLPQPAQRAVVPADTAGTTARCAGTPPELNKPVIPTVFTPAVTDENGEPLCGVRLATASGTLTALTDSVGQVQLPGETLVLSIDKSVIQRFVVGEDKPPSIMLSTRNPAGARLKPVRRLFNSSLRPGKPRHASSAPSCISSC